MIRFLSFKLKANFKRNPIPNKETNFNHIEREPIPFILGASYFLLSCNLISLIIKIEIIKYFLIKYFLSLARKEINTVGHKLNT
jgi:hypothetical protein